MSSWVTTAIIMAAVGYVIVKRLMGEPLNARDLAGTPLILTGIGAYQLTKVDGLVATDYGWLAGSVIIGVLCGAVRGTTIELFTRDGVLWQRYRGWTFATWLLSLVLSGGFGLLSVAAGMNEGARSMMLSIGIGMVGEMITLGLRALSTGRPFSPHSKDSRQAHRQVFDDLGRRVQRARHPASGTDRHHGGAQRDDMDRSPSLRDGVGWLTNAARDARTDPRR
jgi:hypothetical protein